MVDGDVVPIVNVLFLFLDQFQFLPGIIDQGTQFFLFRFTDLVAENFVDFALDIARGIF